MQKFVVDESVLDKFPKLRVLATPSTGTDHINKKACEARGVRVLSLLDDRVGLETISASAEFALLMLLTMWRRYPCHELQDKTIGLVGLGRIGQRLLRWLAGMGCRVVFHDPNVPGSLSLKKVFVSNAVVVCCELNDVTRGMIGAKEIERLKPDGVFVNVSRGNVVREDELVPLMKKRPDIRIALDVLCGEEEGKANPRPLIEGRAFVTPHVAGNTFESRTKAAKIILELIRGCL